MGFPWDSHGIPGPIGNLYCILHISNPNLRTTVQLFRICTCRGAHILSIKDRKHRITSCTFSNVKLRVNIILVVFTKATTPHRFRPSAVRCRTLLTVDCTTTAPSTQLAAATWDVITATDSGSLANNRPVRNRVLLLRFITPQSICHQLIYSFHPFNMVNIVTVYLYEGPFVRNVQVYG